MIKCLTNFINVTESEMGGILSYFFPETDHDATEQVQDDNIVEEVSVAVEDTPQENLDIAAIEVADLVILF